MVHGWVPLKFLGACAEGRWYGGDCIASHQVLRMERLNDYRLVASRLPPFVAGMFTFPPDRWTNNISQGKLDFYLPFAILPSPVPSLNHPTAPYLYPLSQDIASKRCAVSSTSEDIDKDSPRRAFCAWLSGEIGKGWGGGYLSTHVHQYSFNKFYI